MLHSEKVSMAVEELYGRDSLTYAPIAATGVELVGVDRNDGTVFVKNTEGTAMIGYGDHYAVRDQVGDRDACEKLLQACAAADAQRKICSVMGRPDFVTAEPNDKGLLGKFYTVNYYTNRDGSALVAAHNNGRITSEGGHPDACAALRADIRARSAGQER